MSLKTDKQARKYAGRISKGNALQHAIAGKAYLLVAEGNLLVRKGVGVTEVAEFLKTQGGLR